MAAHLEKCEVQTDETTSEGSNDKYSAAKAWLFQKLGKGGLVVLKHGRHGRPKTRRLQCDFNVSRVFCRSDSVYKEVLITEIASVRRGTDVDPASQLDPIFATGNDSVSTGPKSSPLFKKKLTILDQPNVSFGTANLRRYCRQQDMPLCVSLITDERTFDIQFMSSKDATDFYNHMMVMVSQNVSTRPPSLGVTQHTTGSSASTSTSHEESMPLSAEDALVEDEVHAALDVQFLLSQGFTESQILSMCQGIREEALLRSKKTASIRKSLHVNVPLDLEQEAAREQSGYDDGAFSAGTSDDEDDLSAEDKVAVNKLMREKGYSEEQALQVHLQSLFINEAVAINVNASSPEPINSGALTTAGQGDLQV